jgi:hypothetical protein
VAQRVVFATFAALLTGACCEAPKTPCLSWLEDGETYRVELVQHFDADESVFGSGVAPYDRYSHPERTCGRGLDLDVGSVMRVTAEEKVHGDGRRGCSCNYRRAGVEIEGVVRTANVPQGRSIGPYDFSDQFGATIGGDCDVSYTIGIARVEESFLAASDQHVATDHILYRKLVIDDVEACAAEGSQAAETRVCWDNWAVRVWDSTGTLITTDGPASDPDAGAGSTDDGGP